MNYAAVAAAERLEPRQLLKALRAFKRGDFSVRLPADLTGIDGEIAEAFNEVVELNDADDARVRAPRPRRRQGRQDQPARQAGRTPPARGATASMPSTP